MVSNALLVPDAFSVNMHWNKLLDAIESLVNGVIH